MIYICIPTHNEQQTVGVVLWKLRQVLTEFHRDYQLLVADDASTDKTPEVLEPYTRVLPLTVIRSDRQLGHAASLEMLLREAVRRSEYPKRDIIVTLQADFSEEPDDVVPMIKRIEAGVDLVIGNKVSVTRPTRLRRLARALGTFFTRSQQWPEGVTSPFDGYRAYRLYAVKRAVEDGGGRRLVRYDGWAGNAELLRAVLPHARRVEALDVEDRADRLQRPRRERPIAAALQVRPMVRGVEPSGLASVEELDRVATTASRSRDAAARLAQQREVERAAAHERGNGRSRQRAGEGGRPRNGRERSAGRGEARERGGPGRAQAGAKAMTATERPCQPRAAAPVTKGAESGEKPRPPRRPERTDAAPVAGTAAPVPEAVQAEGGVPDLTEVGGQATEAPRKKRRRRRRRGGSGAGAPPTQPAGGESFPASTADALGAGPLEGEAGELGEPGEAGERPGAVQGSTEAREPKRRRRRGGRGRRRGPRAAGNAGAVSEVDSERDGAPTDLPADAPLTTPAPAPPAVRDEE